MRKNNNIWTLIFLCIFLACKHGNGSQTLDKPKESTNVYLRNLKINSSNIEILDEIDLKKTKANGLDIECEVFPYDAEIEFSVELEGKNKRGGKWNLGNEVGNKSLKIIVKKDREIHSYNIVVEKQREDALSIKNILFEGENYEGDKIFSMMSFKDISASFSNIKVVPSSSLARVEFIGYGETLGNGEWKWLLASGYNSLRIKLILGDEVVEYVVRVRSTLPAVGVNWSLNGVYSFKMPDRFEDKASDGENPLFYANCNHLYIGFWTKTNVKRLLTINNGKVEEVSLKGSDPKTSEKLYMLDEKEQQFEIFIVPDDSLKGKVACLNVKFRAKGNEKKVKPKAMLSINGNPELPNEFLSNLEGNKSPLYKIFKGPAKLGIQVNSYSHVRIISEIKINGEKVPYSSENLEDRNIVKKQLQVALDSQMPVKVEFIPSNKDIFEGFTWNFNLELGGDKPPVFAVQFLAINDLGIIGEGELPEYLTKHLQDGVNPLYEYDGTTADLVLRVHDSNLVKDAHFKIDDDSGVLEPLRTKGKNAYLKHTYNILDKEEHNVEIVIHPKNTSEYQDAIWKFRLKRTGKKIQLVPEPFNFSINRIPDLKMPKEIKEHLVDGSAPLYEVEGFDANISIITFSEVLANRIKELVFRFGDGEERRIPFKKNPLGIFNNWIASTSFELEKKGETCLFTLELVPQDKEKYEGFVYSLKLKTNGKKIPMPLVFAVDKKARKDGSHITIDGKEATVLVQSEKDIMKKVSIAIKGVDDVDCPITEQTNKEGVIFYDARRKIKLEDGTIEKIVIIKVEPKETEKYVTTTCTYKITAK